MMGGASEKDAAELVGKLERVARSDGGGGGVWVARDGVWTTVRMGARVGCAKRARHLKHGDEPMNARGFLIAAGRLVNGRPDYGPRAVRAKMQRAVQPDAGA